MPRELTAVLAADVVGYSRLMGSDPEGTLGALRRLRSEVIGPTVAGCSGRMVKSMGDGWIVSLRSAAEAVMCAMQLQDKMVDEPEVRLRTGVHLGDVSFEDEDVFGEGVNIAARLEAICKPGGVAISDATYVMLDGTLRPAFDDAGERTLKNIDRPLRIWTRGGIAGANAIKSRHGMSGFPKLVVEPVSTSSEDSEIEELADALTHDLSTYLGAIRWLQTSVSDAGVACAYHLRQRLRSTGQRIRLESRLTSPDDDVVWSGKNDGHLNEVFEWQDKTGSNVAAHTLAAMTDSVLTKVTQTPTGERSWEDWVVLAAAGYSPNREKLEAGIEYLENAISLSPNSSYPYELALNGLVSSAMLGFMDIYQTHASKAATWWEGVRQTDTSGFDTRVMSAVVRYNQIGDIDETRKDIDAFLRDLPYDPEALIQAGYTFLFMGEPNRALECFEAFERVGKHHPYLCLALHGIGSVHLLEDQPDLAIPYFEKAIRREPGYPPPYRWKAAALALLGNDEEAQATMKTGLDLTPGVTVRAVKAGSRYVETNAMLRIFQGFLLAGMPE